MDSTKTKVVGNVGESDGSYGFKSEIVNTFEQYAAEGVNIATDLPTILATPSTAQQFVDVVTESVSSSPSLSKEGASDDPFYSNYAERLAQLAENSNREIVRESVMTGYAPIVAYAPFFLKKQWISCVWKDVLLTEVPNNPVINYQFQKRYIKDMAGNRYEIPDIYYNKAAMQKLLAESTGVALKEDPIPLTVTRNLNLVDTSKNADPTVTYLEDGFVTRDLANALNPDMYICGVVVTDANGTTHALPAQIMLDITTHNFMNGHIKYEVKDANGNVTETIEDTLIGNVDFDKSTITVMSTKGTATSAVTAIKLRGKTSNRFNHRSLDVERRVERIERIMPESGPRLNSAVTIEEAADALAIGNIDMFADNCDMMGNALANLEDIEIKSFMDNSYDAQKAADAAGIVDNNGYTNLIVEGRFNTIPFGGYGQNITNWMQDAKEYFERILEKLKYKLNTSQCLVTCVCHPSLIRFIKNDVRWVFTNETNIAGLKLQYDFGVTTSNGGDRVHFVTSRYMSPEEGIRLVLIPTTTELITYKHLKYSVTVDRGYRNPLEPLVPNIMATQRTLTFEIIPVQGKMMIDGREMESPANVGYSTVVHQTLEEVTGGNG